MGSGCPNCGAENKPGARFCNECGIALTAAVPGAPRIRQPAASGSERRLVTVLFADIVGFTPFAEERDAEDVRETLSRYFDLCSDVVGRYGGTIEKFIGDAVMAVWGAPAAHEDDAERAVRSALDLIDAVAVIASGVQARAGVLTGEAAVTVGATNQGMVAGDLVNTASRLQSVAPAGAVLVGESTMRATSDAVVYEVAGEHLLKGKEAPVAAWRAVRVVAERGGRNRSDQLEAPFVGRADELRLLKDLFHATGREQKVRLVSVIGPAGIGKSRLAWEFLKYVDGLVETTYWHDGRSPAYGEGISFWALGEMVRGRAGLRESDDEPTTRQKIGETVAQWVSDPDERAWVERALLALLGIEASLPPEEMFAAWRTLFERISDQGTVTLVFEDLQLADSGLIDFIEHMLDWSRSHPIYIVTLSRPELLDRRPDWGDGKRNFTSIYLEPLSPADMRELLAGLVPGLPDTAAAAIVARADGIPLYAVETVRMLVADGRLVERNGRYEPVGDLGSLAVPETLTALIRSRLDALDPVERGLIADAAVLGQTFAVAPLTAVHGDEPSDIESGLRRLVNRELIVSLSDPRSAERGQFAFVQGLIREVAYNTLSKRDRKARHLAAARYYEQIGSDELAGALAGHYVAAHDNAQDEPERDALAGQARLALKGAAQRSGKLGSHGVAARFLGQAIALASSPSETAQLHELAATEEMRAGHVDEAVSHAEAAVGIWKELGDRSSISRAIAVQGLALLEARLNQAAMDLLEPANSEYADAREGEEAARFNFIWARALNQADRNAEAVAVADEGLEIAEHGVYLMATARLLITKGAALAALGRVREGIALINGTTSLARANGWDEILSGALTVTTAVVGETEPRLGWNAGVEAVEIAVRTGQRDLLGIVVGNILYTGFTLGEWQAAVDMAAPYVHDDDLLPGQRIFLLSNWIIIRTNRGEDVSADLEEMTELLKSLGNEEELAGAANDAYANDAQAKGELDKASTFWRAAGGTVVPLEAWACYQEARAALWNGNLDAVRADLAKIENSSLRGPTVDARAATVRAGIEALEGNTTKAIASYRDAIQAWHALDLTWDEALTGLDMVSVLDTDLPEVKVVAEATRKIFELLGAKPYLARLNARLEEPPATAADPALATDAATSAVGSRT